MTGSGTRDREIAGPQDDADVYDGALFSLEGDFADYLGLETKYFTAHGGAVPEETLHAIREYGKTL